MRPPVETPQNAVDRVHGARRLGFGISGALSTGLITPNDVENLVVHAYDLGVRYFDTGPSYGNGEAERRLGHALRRLQVSQLTVSTKVGLRSQGVTGRVRDFSPGGVRRSLDQSLARLQLERIDWVFLHGPGPEDLTDGLFQALQQELHDGRVAAFGVAGRGQELEAAAATGLFRMVMMPVHCQMSQVERARVASLRARSMEIIGIEALAPAMPRYPIPDSAGSVYRLARSLVRGGGAPSRPRKRRPSTGEALHWALGEGMAHRVLVTTSSPAHLEQNVSVACLASRAV